MPTASPKPIKGIIAVKTFFGMTMAEMKEEFTPLDAETKEWFRQECEKAMAGQVAN